MPRQSRLLKLAQPPVRFAICTVRRPTEHARARARPLGQTRSVFRACACMVCIANIVSWFASVFFNCYLPLYEQIFVALTVMLYVAAEIAANAKRCRRASLHHNADTLNFNLPCVFRHVTPCHLTRSLVYY